jgi:hypothetical protein
MLEGTIRDSLLLTLAEHYEKDPGEFWHVSQSDLASAYIRVTVAELRNEGYVEEKVRGEIRLTARGYQAYRSGMPLTYAS